MAIPAALLAGTPQASTPAPKPDIVLVLTDDQRWDTLWAMPTVQNEIGARGVTFANAFVVNSLCCPSRASILTGQYSHGTGVYSNKGGYEDFHDASTLATWLDEVGYRTGLVGKYLNGYNQPDAGYIPPGWDRWVAFTSQTGQGQYYDYSVTVDGTPMSYGSDPEDYSTDVLASYATDFISSTPAGTPLFLLFTPKAPHVPGTPAPRHADAFSDLPPWRPLSFNEPNVVDKPSWLAETPQLDAEKIAEMDGYHRDSYGSLLAVDEALGQILATLEAADRLSNAMVVFASDNGYLWGEHRWDGKKVLYEESIRVPMVIRYDPLTSPHTNGRLVLNIDLAPTFASLAEVPAPGADGASLLPLLAGHHARWREDFLVENSLDSGGADTVPTFCAVRSRRYVYAAFLATGEGELYDVLKDRYQLKNRVNEPRYADIVASLHDRLMTLCSPLPP